MCLRSRFLVHVNGRMTARQAVMRAKLPFKARSISEALNHFRRLLKCLRWIFDLFQDGICYPPKSEETHWRLRLQLAGTTATTKACAQQGGRWEFFSSRQSHREKFSLTWSAPAIFISHRSNRLHRVRRHKIMLKWCQFGWGKRSRTPRDNYVAPFQIMCKTE